MGYFKLWELVNNNPELMNQTILINISLCVFLWDCVAVGPEETETFIYIINCVIFDTQMRDKNFHLKPKETLEKGF